MRRLALLTALLACVCCGVEPKSEDYGATLPQELVLTPSNHPHGWTQSQCYGCHVSANLHERTSISASMSAYAKRLTATRGLESCKGCHGRNGVGQ